MILTEHIVTQAILCRREFFNGQHGPPLYARAFCMPRYTPPGWHEMDVMEITATNMMREYEVKLTRADFRADAKKEAEGERKYTRLMLGDTRGPARFWYVVPAGLNVRDCLPEWAGLIEIDARLRLRQVVKAARLHREPADPVVREHARNACYRRYHRLLIISKGGMSIDCEEESAVPVGAD